MIENRIRQVKKSMNNWISSRKVFFWVWLLTIPLLLNVIPAAAQDRSAERHKVLLSPDGQLAVTLYWKAEAGAEQMFSYSLTYKGRQVIGKSLLDIQLDNHLSEEAMAIKPDTSKRWCQNLKVTGFSTDEKDTTWRPVHGEYARIRDHYSSLTMHTEKESNPIYKMDIELRAYNEGLALRYFFPENEKGTYYYVTGENTGFSFAPGTKAWVAGWAQGPYSKLPLKNWKDESERPLTLELPGGLYVSLAEAGVTDYVRTKFALSPKKEGTITTSMFEGAQMISPFGTPWRVILVAEQPGKLLEHNWVLLNLNQPSSIKNPDWIKPGKIMRVMKQTTRSAMENIDLAQKLGLQYILFDWKWYGPAFSFSSDATKVAIADFDLPAIISYGKARGIGVWLYVNLQGLVAQSDSLFSIYHGWGIKGVKFGFVQAGSHRWTTWLENELKLGAQNKIMVNVHDDWRPTGQQRTWPNLMTAEGIRGNEEMPDATSNTVMPFTRFIAGPADYTICYFDPRIKTTHAHQIALAAIYYSPIQTLFWYDEPKAFHDEPELQFFREIPTAWDDTKVIDGVIGQFVTIARKKGENWFVGSITNNQPRKVHIPLSFLEKGRSYELTSYVDDPKVNTRTHVGLLKKRVTAKDSLDFNLLPSGGVALRLKPVL